MIFIVGGRGLTGSAVMRHCEANGFEYRVLQRDNHQNYHGEKCDVLIYANGNALKWKANENPHFDFHASLATTVEYVHNIRYGKYVHLSTVDVYSDKTSLEGTSEEAIIDPAGLDVYGFHKFMAEEYVRKFVPDNHLILRLPGLVGPGLQKNPVYDFLHDEKKVMISADSILNFIHTDVIAQTLFQLLNSGATGTFNVASSNSIRIGDIASLTGVETGYTGTAEQYKQQYVINTARLAKWVTLTTSAEAVLQYWKDLAGNGCF